MSGPGVLCEGLVVTEIFGAHFQQRGVGIGLVESRTGRLFAAGASEVFESSRIIFYFISRFLVMSSNYQTSFPYKQGKPTARHKEDGRQERHMRSTME